MQNQPVVAARGFARTAFAFGVLAMTPPALQAAPGDPLGAAFEVSAIAARNSQGPAAARNPSGVQVVAWEDETGEQERILAQRYAADGSRLGPRIVVDASTDFVGSAAVAISASGSFAVSWSAFPGSRAYLRLFDEHGVATTSALQLDESVSDRVSVAMDADGDLVAAWSLNPPGTRQGRILAQRFDRTGAPNGAAFRVSPVTLINHHDPVVAMDDDGDFAVAWQSNAALGEILGSGYFICCGFQGLQSRVWTRRYTADGHALSRPKAAATVRAYQFVAPPDTNSETGREIAWGDVDLAMQPDGRYVVSWLERGRGTTSNVARFRRYGADGEPAAAVTVAEGGPLSPAIGVNASGDVVVAWTQADADVFYRRYRNDDTPRGDARETPPLTGTLTIGGPDVSVGPGGEFSLFWSGLVNPPDARIQVVFGQHFEGP